MDSPIDRQSETFCKKGRSERMGVGTFPTEVEVGRPCGAIARRRVGGMCDAVVGLSVADHSR